MRVIVVDILLPVVIVFTMLADFSAHAFSDATRVALVTGANKGIGKEIARLLGKEENMICIMAGRSLSLVEDAKKDLENDGCTNLYGVHMDLTQPESFDTVQDFVNTNFDGRLDILINNAAICFNDPTLYGKVEYAPFEQQARLTIDTNFWGTWKLTQTLIPCLLKSDSPRIINVASAAGRLAILKSDALKQQFVSDDLTVSQIENLMNEFVQAVEGGRHQKGGWPNTCYGMSKLGIIAMTRVLARSPPYTDLFMCNSVDPGYCATDQNNNQGIRPASRGAVTPFLLATLPKEKFYTGLHWFDEQTVDWAGAM